MQKELGRLVLPEVINSSVGLIFVAFFLRKKPVNLPIALDLEWRSNVHTVFTDSCDLNAIGAH